MKIIQKMFIPQIIAIYFVNIWVYISYSYALELTPYKYDEIPPLNYEIPASTRFTIKRTDVDQNLVYYFSKPKNIPYTIALLVGGSSAPGELTSIIHLHRYFLKEINDLGLALITIEQIGIDGNNVYEEFFWKNYTRSRRLNDHKQLIEYFKTNPPKGWDGKLIFIGGSEGGPIVTDLTIAYPKETIATINWVGAGDWSWYDELWAYIEDIKNKEPWWVKITSLLPRRFQIFNKVSINKQEYYKLMNEITENPLTDQWFMGLTFMYHADALKAQPYDYNKIKTPYLVVTGVLDSVVHSSDQFVEKAKKAKVPITYFRIEDMGHTVRKRQDILDKSFQWLSIILKEHAQN
jgi:pimeloyl-ACP methyl ester carboxylesterase